MEKRRFTWRAIYKRIARHCPAVPPARAACAARRLTPRKHVTPHTTWFKVALEITRSGLGADQLRGVIKHHKGTITVEFDLSRPLFLD